MEMTSVSDSVKMLEDSMGQDQAEQSGNPLIVEPEEKTQRKSYLELDTVKIKERHTKIVDFFGDNPKKPLWMEIKDSLPDCVRSTAADNQPHDEVDAENQYEAKIDMAKLKTVIRRLHTSTNPSFFFWFMNAISAYKGRKSPSEEWKEMKSELDKIETGELTVAELYDYTKKVISAKPEKKKRVKSFWTKCTKSWSPDGRSAGQKVLKYIDAVANAKKIYLSPKRILFPVLSLLHLVIFAFIQARPDSGLLTLLQFDTTQRGELWRYLTYSLVHKDLQHVMVNSLLLLCLGYGLEVAHGSGWVALLYILGVFSSSIAFFCFSSGTLRGCSGGVFCLVAASLSTIILNWNQDKVVLVRVRKDKAPRASAGRMRQFITVMLIIAFALINIVPASIRRFQHNNAGISEVAHFFGAIAGFLTGFLLLKDEVEEQWEKTWKFLCLAAYCLGLGIGIGVNLTGYRGAVGFFW